MPEVPEHMQQNLAHLELEATEVRRNPPTFGPRASPFPVREGSLAATASVRSAQEQQGPPNVQYSGDDSSTVAREYPAQHPAQHHHQRQDPGQDVMYSPAGPPRFSPFPQLLNPPPNVPPSDEEKEANLEQARVQVLNSDDPEIQLAWAQDTLSYVEVAMQHEARVSEQQPRRPQTPQVEHQLRVDAVSVVSFLAEQHHPKAEFMRGMWLEFGKFGVRVDPKDAYRSYARAAEKGYGRAEYRMGMQYESSNEPAKAIKHYHRGVAMGDSASNYRLGMMILLGQHGQRQDYQRGLEHIRFAADTADENAPQGAYVYGMLLARELDSLVVPEQHLPLELGEARVYIEKAAYLGFAKAQVKMGAAYELCQLGCDFNPALSLHYNALAARQGEGVAEMAVSKWFLCGYEGVFEKNEELAFVFAQRAARTGLPTAEFAMGYFHEIGVYVPVNVQEARRWYDRAAEHGNQDALARIDSIARSKTLSKRDHEQVAIQRIKSQYGSQRGRRPARFSTRTEPMPAIPDGHLPMPDPAQVHSPLRRGPLLPPAGVHPSRSQSAMGAPYPSSGPGPFRPSSRPGTATSLVSPHARLAMSPSLEVRSATATIPDAHDHGAHTASRPRPGPAGGGDYRPVELFDGVYTADDDDDDGHHHHHHPLASANPPRLSGSANTGHGGGGMTSAEMDPATGGRSALPRLDIGFVAPPDPNVERRARLQPTRTPIGNKPVPDRQGTPPSRPSSRPHHPPGLAATVRLGVAQPTGPPPGGMRPSRTKPGLSDLASFPETASHPPTTAPPPSQPVAVTPRPPGKGPKTFEEMGVPIATKENDCVRVFCSTSYPVVPSTHEPSLP